MVDLSIGQVAGAINLGLLFLQITLPLLQVLVIIGMLRNRHTAATWSIVSQLVLSTLLPTILSCDTAAERKTGMPKRIIIMKYTMLFLAILVAVSGVMSPIGLGEDIVRGPLVSATFGYAPDPSIFGEGTPSRVDYVLSRTCGRKPCPGVNSSDTVTSPYGPLIRPNIPQNVSECFRSGTNGFGDLRCNPFEIQFRQFLTSTLVDNTTDLTNTTGSFEMLESILLDDVLEVREGVIIDAIKGGIGLRNHTVPIEPRMKYGAEWTEEILWIEPVTTCVDTNWTLELQAQLLPFSQSPNLAVSKLVIVNKGYTGGNAVYKGPTVVPASQSDPRLEERVSIAAYRFGGYLSRMIQPNQSTAAPLNVGSAYDVSLDSDDALRNIFATSGGQSVGLFLGYFDDWGSTAETISTPSNMTSTTVSLGPSETASAVFNEDGMVQEISLDGKEFNLSAFNLSRFGIYLQQVESAYFNQTNNGSYEAPEPIATSDDTSELIVNDCKGALSGPPSIDNLFVNCGFAITPPRLSDGAFSSTRLENNLTRSIYVCASTIRANVKTVSFHYNGSDSIPLLSNVKVLKVEPKTYDGEHQKPVWGVEDPGQDWNTTDIQLLWGIVDGSKYRDSGALWTVQNDSLYLPAYIMQGSSGVGFGDSMGASRGPGQALFESYPSLSPVYDPGFSSYDGSESRRIMLKWRNLSDSAVSMAHIPNLIWTDRAANMLVGTKSLLDSVPSTRSYPVYIYERKITYNYLYAVPALFCWVFWVFWIGAIAVLSIVGTSNNIGISRCKDLINRLSVGRALAAAEYSSSNHFGDSTTEWMKSTGHLMIDLAEVGKAK